MKRCFLSPLLLALVLFTGCETSQLTVQDDAERLAPVLGVEVDEIQYLGRANFVVRKLGPFGGRYYPKGIIVLTQDEILVYSRYQNLIMSKRYEELEGVSMIESQVHVKDEVHKMVLELGVEPLRYGNSSEREEVYALLTGFNVPIFEMTRASNLARTQFHTQVHSEGNTWLDDNPGPVTLPDSYN